MQFRSVLLVITLALAPSPTLAAASPSTEMQEFQQSTPCEDAATSIAKNTTAYLKDAKNTTIPFDLADNTAKACGVLLPGIKELRDMSCPQSLVDQVVDAHKDVKESLDRINDKYSYRFDCFVPGFL